MEKFRGATATLDVANFGTRLSRLSADVTIEDFMAAGRGT